MALGIGIVGLPNVGKSTLFNALTKAQNAEAANYPFCTIEPNKATVPVPDERLARLAAMVHPQKTVAATVDFIDIAGLVRGASKGEGLGNQFLGNIRDCAAVLQVVRCFEDENITHVDGAVNPARDVETVETELILADLQSVEKRLERVRKNGKADKTLQGLVQDLEDLSAHLNQGSPAAKFPGGNTELFQQCMQELRLLSAKPTIFCANVDENLSSGESPEKNVAFLKELELIAGKRNAPVVPICAKLEEELQGLSSAEQDEMLKFYGISAPGLEKIIRI
jgi:GTP-binding protein YchF